MAHRFRPPEHEITHATCSDFILHSTNWIVAIVGDLLAAQKEVAAGTLSKTKYKELESLYGFSPTAEGVWGDLELVHALRLPHSVSYDWPHATLHDGSLPAELPLYCKDLESTTPQFDNFLNGWAVADHQQLRSFRKLKRIVTSGVSQSLDRPTCSEYLALSQRSEHG